MKLLLIAGARPNFMKIAPVARALDQHPGLFTYQIVHTGQHYDYEMSRAFFEDLGIPAPDHYLNAGSGTHAEQTAKIISNIKTEYAIDQRREVDLLNQLRLAREEGLSASQTSSLITTLDTEIKEDRRIYELINSRIKEIDLNQETITNNIRIIEEAMLPKSPVRPRRLFNIAAGVLLGLILGVGTVFFIDYLDNTIKSSGRFR